jgi:steroid delta-isomerase-like uncharacterized protein
MGTNENKALVRAHYEATVNNYDEAAIDQQIADEFFDHAAGARLGPEGVKRHIKGLQAVFPDLRVTIEDILAEGDRVAVRATWRGTHKGDFRGVPASHQPIEFTGMVFWRIAENEIVERWASVDVLGPVRRAAECP